MKDKLFNYIDNNNRELLDLAKYIYDNPETGLKEYKASKAITDYLIKNGFTVEYGVGGLETSFRAVYNSGNDGASIGLLCEYDALEGIGHACGHHMQAPAILLTAIALKEVLKDCSYKIVVYGTPAEENLGGKVIMVDNGCFRDIDVALMFHGMTATIVDTRSLAMTEFEVEFHGKSSHAALFPYEGRSAMDALLLAFNGIEFMREHVKEDSRMHYTVLDAGGPANVVPGKAKGSFSLRSYNYAYLETLIKRFEKIIQGAALMTETEYSIKKIISYMSKIPVFKLNDILMENARLVGAPNIKPPIEQSGSTDFANVMYNTPGSVIRVAFVSENASVHSKEFLEAGKTEAASNAIIMAGKILAATSYELISDKELLKNIKEEFIRNKEELSKI